MLASGEPEPLGAGRLAHAYSRCSPLQRGNILLRTSLSLLMSISKLHIELDQHHNSRHWQHWSYLFLTLTNSICNGHWEPSGEDQLVHACSRCSPWNRGSIFLGSSSSLDACFEITHRIRHEETP